MPTALVFPGQGSQRAGAGAPWRGTSGWDDVPGTLSRQLTAPVRWREVLEALPALGVDRVVEVGPGGVLTALVRRTLPGVRALSIATPTDLALLD